VRRPRRVVVRVQAGLAWGEVLWRSPPTQPRVRREERVRRPGAIAGLLHPRLRVRIRDGVHSAVFHWPRAADEGSTPKVMVSFAGSPRSSPTPTALR
jgi:hypothetical protein